MGKDLGTSDSSAKAPFSFDAASIQLSEGRAGAAKVMLRPATPGTGVIAGGSVRVVLEMAGVENALGKQLGSDNALNNARATVDAILKMRQFSEVSLERGIPMEELWK
ncbi:ribosomal protein S5 [Asimina triloba]